MTDKPDYLQQGEAARLFPALAATSKEGYATSVFLSILCHVPEYAEALLGSIGQKVSSRSKLDAYTEVVFKEPDGNSLRSDGLIILSKKNYEWRAIIESKIGASTLSRDQIINYLEICKKNSVDAIITISKDFTTDPTQSALRITQKKVQLYHWSWAFLLTQAHLLISDGRVEDEERNVLLREFVKFLSHPSAGLRRFDSMPPAWPEIVKSIQARAHLKQQSAEVREVVAAWHQETRDLSLQLSEIIGVPVRVQLPRNLARDPKLRSKTDAENLVKNGMLGAKFLVPNAAAPLDVCVDLSRRTVLVSMKLRAPQDKKTTTARVRWLLRQIERAKGLDKSDTMNPDGVYIRLYWPGRGPYTQRELEKIEDDIKNIQNEKKGLVPHSMEVCRVWDFGGAFSKRRKFIEQLERIVPEFYERIGQHLRAYQPPAPKVRRSGEEMGDERPPFSAGRSEQHTTGDGAPQAESEEGDCRAKAE